MLNKVIILPFIPFIYLFIYLFTYLLVGLVTYYLFTIHLLIYISNYSD